MTGRDLFAFATGALRGHRLRTVLSLLGVAIGVAAVILLTSLGEGARVYVTGEFASLGTNLLILLPGKTETTGLLPVVGGVPHDLTLADVEAIRRQVAGVRHLTPIVIGQATARFGEKSRELTVAGTTSELLPIRKIPIHVGRFLPEGEIERGERVVVIGSTVRTELFGALNPLGEILRVGDERFRVIGVLAPHGVSVGLSFDDMIYIPASQAMRMFNLRSVFRVLIELTANEAITRTKNDVLAVVAERHDHEEDITILTQDAVISTFGKVFAVLTAALTGIAAISLSVAGIGIMNVMLVSVSERTSEIGLLKALGATPAQVLALFLAEASILSIAGGAAGLAAGFGGAGLVRALYPSFPVEPPLWAVVSAILVSIAVGTLFGTLPARRAARLDPIAALSRR